MMCFTGIHRVIYDVLQEYIELYMMCFSGIHRAIHEVFYRNT